MSHMARRRRWLDAGVLVGVLVLVTAAVTWWVGPRQEPGTWQRLDAPPIRPATKALVAWTGRLVVVAGGDLDAPCGERGHGGSSCAPTGSADAAAYDPATGEWERLTNLPERMYDAYPHVAADGKLYVATPERHLFVLDPEAGEWSRIGLPEGRRGSIGSLAAAEGHLYAVVEEGRGGPMSLHVLDLAAGRWSALPLNPLRPVLTNGRLAATPDALLLTGQVWPTKDWAQDRYVDGQWDRQGPVTAPEANILRLLPPDGSPDGTRTAWSEDYLYAFGGAVPGTADPTVITNHFWRYRPE